MPTPRKKSRLQPGDSLGPKTKEQAEIQNDELWKRLNAKAIDEILQAARTVGDMACDRTRVKLSAHRANGVARELRELAKVLTSYGYHAL